MAASEGKDLVEDIKDRLAIEDVIGEYLELKRAGRNFKAKSPFNAEKTASFMVSPEKQIWHDFSSGKGGTLFGFVMEMEGVDFKGSLDILAQKAGLEPSDYRRGGGGNEKRKRRVLSALELATKFYQTQLVHNREILNYVTKKRGFNKESVSNFGIGYAPNSFTALHTFMSGKGYTDQELKDAGLCGQGKRGPFDMFRGRMMVPLRDPQGQTIGFTARQVVDDPESPKYINTPQTLVYDKSRHVYGLERAKDAIRRAGYAVITEGNLDVVTSHQVGVKNVVATAGTAMTVNHLKAIGRLASDIRLAFDSDRAGIAATERAIELAQSIDIQLSVITMPEGKDPDDIAREDPAAWQKAIDSQQYAVDWLYDRYHEQLDVSSATGKRDFTDIVLKVINGLSDPVEKDHYLRKLGEDVEISLEALNSKLSQVSDKAKPRLKKPKVEQQTTPVQDSSALEDQFLGLLLMYPTTRRVAQTADERILFSRPGRQEIFDYLLDNQQAVIDDMQPPQELQNQAEYVKLAVFTAEQQYKDFDSNERLREANDLATKLIKNSKKQRKSNLIKELKQAEDDGDAERAADIMAKIDTINKSL